jgi:hypothetical protein
MTGLDLRGHVEFRRAYHSDAPPAGLPAAFQVELCTPACALCAISS